MRCLDIGTMDGFWAFELERRGAGEVVASDVLDATRLDRFVADRLGGRQHRRPSERNFALAAELRGSRIALRDLNVYELDPDEVGEFDLVVMGYVLQMLRDPLRGLEAVRRVCRGQLILLDTVSRPLELLHAPLARLDARRDGSEWFVFNRRGLRKALELTGWVVEETTPVLRDHAGPGVGARERALRFAKHALASAAAAPPSGLTARREPALSRRYCRRLHRRFATTMVSTGPTSTPTSLRTSASSRETRGNASSPTGSRRASTPTRSSCSRASAMIEKMASF